MLLVKTTTPCVSENVECHEGNHKVSWALSCLPLKFTCPAGECSKRQAEGRNICICSQMSRDAWRLWGCDKVAWASYDQVRGTIVAWECWQIPQTIPKKAALIMRWMSTRCQHVWGKSGWHFTLTAHSFLLQQFYWSQVISRGAKTAAEEISSQLI